MLSSLVFIVYSEPEREREGEGGIKEEGREMQSSHTMPQKYRHAFSDFLGK